jgi:hypothetical protein
MELQLKELNKEIKQNRNLFEKKGRGGFLKRSEEFELLQDLRQKIDALSRTNTQSDK